MQNVLKTLGLTGAGVLLLSASFMARAVPVLQLDIIGGTYDALTQTIVTSDNSFTLVAYGKVGSITLTDNFYISAAVVPQIGPTAPVGGIGSFDVDGVTWNSVDGTYDISNMIYGNPPIESVATQLGDAGDLQDHQDLFDTYFKELLFQFNASQRTASVDVQLNTGTTPVNDANGGLYYQLFNIDVGNLLDGYNLHFDLYNEKICTATTGPGSSGCYIVGDVDVNKFAPFSHDAETRKVPEPAPLALLAIGLLGLVLTTRRQSARI